MPRSVRTIGQVMKTLKPDFPDLSISKIRFLESEGLLSPERAPSGYRKYSDSDVERLRYILTCQRDHFQPLRVIRDHLEMMDRGEEPPVSEAPPLPTENEGTPDPQPQPTGQGIVRTRGPIRMNRRELIRASGITEAMLMELERHQLYGPSGEPRTSVKRLSLSVSQHVDWRLTAWILVTCVPSGRLRSMKPDL